LTRENENVVMVGKVYYFQPWQNIESKKRPFITKISVQRSFSGTLTVRKCDKGDSGAFIMTGRVKPSGYFVGAIKSMRLVSSEGEGEVFSQACFIEISEALRWVW
jgi:hypothetical protein